MSLATVTNAFVRCDGATFPPSIETEGEPIVHVRTTAEYGDVNLRVDALAAKLVGSISQRAEDLIYIATYCAAADQRVDRGTSHIDVHREQWRRRLTVIMPVADPDFWNQSAVTRALEEVLYTATEDMWRLLFVPRPPTLQQLRLTMSQTDNVANEPTSVVLFSGGMDSVCATVAEVAKGHSRPIVVSHRVGNHIDKWQRDLLDEVRFAFPDWPIPHVSFNIHKQGVRDPDPSQRTRAFLYASLGAAVAASFSIPRVVLADYGYVSINPPISGELAGALASRGTHPTFLRLMNHLLTLIFVDPVVLENPLRHTTRAEALGYLKLYGAAGLFAGSHTCGHHRGSQRTNAVPHCGGCSQCVDRRTAVVASDLEIYDPAHRYGIDIFTHTLPPGEPEKVTVSYFLMAQTLATMDPDSALRMLPTLHDCLDPEGDDYPIDATELADVLIRHSQEAVDVLRRMYQRYAGDLAANTLPEGTLLRRLASPIRPVRITSTNPDRRDDYAMADEHPELEQSHGVWHIRYRGEKASIRDAKGMQYLARLLKAPGQDVMALDLVSGSSSSPNTNRDDDLQPDSVQAADPLLDAQAERDLKRRAKEIEDILDSDSPGPERESLIDELDFIAKTLKGASGLAGRRRTFDTEHMRARTSVGKAIRRSLDVLKHEHPALHAHLESCLGLGRVCRYDPQPRVTWHIAA